MRCITLILILCFVIPAFCADIIATLDTADGSSAFVFKDAASSTVGSIDSNGNLVIAGSIEVSAGILIGNSTDNVNGTIRWTGADFEGRKGGSWVTLTGGGDFSNGGEASGADRSLGNTDNYDLSFLANNSTLLHLDKNGGICIGTTEVGIATASGTIAELHVHEASNGPGIVRISGTGLGYVHSALVTETQDNYRGAGHYIDCNESGNEFTWFAGLPYGDNDQFQIGYTAENIASNNGQKAADIDNALLTLQNDGDLEIKGNYLGGTAYKYEGALVVNGGNVTASWANIDLSSYVGSRRVLAIIEIQNNAGNHPYLAFRPSDIAREWLQLDQYQSGTNAATIKNGGYSQCVIIPTGSDGKVQWKSTGTFGPYNVWLMGWI